MISQSHAKLWPDIAKCCKVIASYGQDTPRYAKLCQALAGNDTDTWPSWEENAHLYLGRSPSNLVGPSEMYMLDHKTLIMDSAFMETETKSPFLRILIKNINQPTEKAQSTLVSSL